PGERHVTVVPTQQIHRRLKHWLAFINCLGAFVHTRVRQVLGDGGKAEALFCHADPEVIVERSIDIRVEATAAICGCADEGCGLTDEAFAFQSSWIPRQRWVPADHRAVLVDPPAFSVDDVYFGMRGQERDRRAHGPGQQGVVRIYPGENLTA